MMSSVDVLQAIIAGAISGIVWFAVEKMFNKWKNRGNK